MTICDICGKSERRPIQPYTLIICHADVKTEILRKTFDICMSCKALVNKLNPELMISNQIKLDAMVSKDG